MAYKAYYHRYGSIDFEEFESLNEAIIFINEQADYGHLFGDCVVNSNGIVVHDFDAETKVIGRKTPKSRLGNLYKI